MPTVDRTPLVTGRQRVADARAARLRAQADLSAAQDARVAVSRTVAPGDHRLVDARNAADAAAQSLESARRAEKTAASNLLGALAAWLGPDPGDDVARLESAFPIVLLPVRLETRFAVDRSELLVRIYPDEIAADTHEPELSAAERAAGVAYWAAAQNANAEDPEAWRTLLLSYPAARAAWIVRATDPSQPPATPPPDKPAGWSRAVEARLLPDRFVLIASRGDAIRRAVGQPIVEPLALSVAPDRGATDTAAFSADGTLVLDEAIKWTVDFDAAVAAGMGIRLPIGPDDIQLGFERVIVVGVKASMDAASGALGLGALIDAQHYTGGVAFLSQGTPTNNIPGSPAAYPPADENGARSFAIERGAPAAGGPDAAAASAGTALGVDAGVFARVDGGSLSEADPARKMNRALFSATLGYYLDQILSPLVAREAVDEIVRHFVQWVVPRGIVPALRVGRAPYGVLPATSLGQWQHTAAATPVERRLVGVLGQLRSTWLEAAARAPRIGRSNDPDQDLIDVLLMDASARQVRVRRAVGDAVYLNLAQLFNWSIAEWHNAHRTTGRIALDAIGIGTATPRVAGLNFADRSFRYHGPLVDVVPGSERDPLGFDYITWIRTAKVADLRQEAVPAEWPANVRRVLLYRLLRHSALAEYHWWAGDLLSKFAAAGTPPALAAGFREPELVGVVPGTESRATPWTRFAGQVQLPGAAATDITALIDADDERLRALTGVGDFRDALAALAPIPTAELERLFGESLDAVSHRLDAWITAMAAKRLSDMRAAGGAATGCFVGAYGWAQDLRVEQGATTTLSDGTVVRTSTGGYIQAPSMAHAMTAAVLRNAYLTHADATESPYAIDLSSARVRMGRFLLDSVRNGQPIGAVLGYLLERALHERQVEMLIDPIRQVAPLVANKTEDSGQPAETVAARNVVDGLTLRAKWKAGQLFDVPGGLTAVPHRDVLEEELANLDRTVDAVADLLLAESVHQIVGGSTTASSAGLDALAQGTRAPDPEIARAPRGGTTITHRVAVALRLPTTGVPGWPSAPTPRAACEPRVDAWIASLLCDPRQVQCRVQYPKSGGGVRTVVVTFDQLQLRATDVVALARAVATAPAATELDRRILDGAFGNALPADADAGASFSIVYEADPAWDRASIRTVPEFLDMANAAGRVLNGARTLVPADVVLAGAASRAAEAHVDEQEALGRANAAVLALTAVQADLRDALDAVSGATPPTAAQIAALRQRLKRAASFGITSSFPPFVGGAQEGSVATLPLADLARGVQAEIGQRLTAANASADAAAKAAAVFGRDFVLFTTFSFPATSAAGAELAQSVARSATLLPDTDREIERWLAQAGRVREPLGRLRFAGVLARAAGGAWPSWRVAQLPHAPDASWIGLPPHAGEERVPGSTSIAFQAPFGTAGATGRWCGLLVDEWMEIIPSDREHTGIAFRYDDTGCEAAQTILVAVPPTTAPVWDFESLVAIVSETLDLAKIRAVDLEELDAVAQIVPAIFLAANAGDDTISTPLGIQLDPVIVKAVS